MVRFGNLLWWPLYEAKLENPQMKYLTPLKTRFFACLSFSAKWSTFFSGILPTSAKLFLVWFRSQSLFSFFCFLLWWLLSLGCESFFSHLSYLLRSYSNAINIYIQVGCAQARYKQCSFVALFSCQVSLKNSVKVDWLMRSFGKRIRSSKSCKFLLYPVFGEIFLDDA